MALVLLVLDLIGIRQGVNSGGHIAHLGGAFYGYLYAKAIGPGGGTGRWPSAPGWKVYLACYSADGVRS